MFHHITVLQKETIEAILPAREVAKNASANSFVVVDCTLGGAGHATELVHQFYKNFEKTMPHLFLYGVDRDVNAIVASKPKLTELKQKYPGFDFDILNTNFSDIFCYFNEGARHTQIHALYADLGVSSPQLDVAERGFSFMREGPLDMRMDSTQGPSAKDVLLNYNETQLTEIFRDFGEEPKAKILAQAICRDRSSTLDFLNNTLTFAAYVEKILKYKNSRTHPATRTFQALRIEVNRELESAQTLLNETPRYLSDNGRVAIVTFHSLEDRLVKKAMRYWESEDKDVLTGGKPKVITPTTKLLWGREVPRGGIEPSEQEARNNSRARSSRLRVFHFGLRAERKNLG